MATTAGTASLEIVGDVRKLAAQLERDAERALRGVDLSLEPQLRELARDGERAFAAISDDAGKEFEQIERSADELFDAFERGGERGEDAIDELGRKARTEFAGMDNSARRAGAGMGLALKAGAVAGAAAIGIASLAVVGFFAIAVTAAEDLGSAIEDTTQIIKSTGGAAGLVADQVRELSKVLGLKIGVDSVEVQQAANILLTFKNVSKATFTEALTLSADLAAVMGTDLRGSVLQVGKALNDPVRGITALARAGVQFTEQQKNQIKSLIANNDLLGAQKIILKELADQVGGVAIAGADVTDQLTAAFLDLKREAGTALLGFLDDNGPRLIELIKSLSPIVAQVGGVLASAATAALPLIEVFAGKLQSGFEALTPAIEPFADVLAAVGSIVVQILPTLVQMAQKVLPILADIFTRVADALLPLIEMILELGVTIVDALLPVLDPIGDALAEVAEVVAGALMQILPPLAEVIVQLVEALLPLIPAVLDLVVAFLPLVQPVVDMTVATIPLLAALIPLVGVLVQIVNISLQVLAAFLPLVDVLLDLGLMEEFAKNTAILAGVITLLLRPLEALSKFLAEFSTRLKALDWSVIGDQLTTAFSRAWNGAVEFFGNISKAFRELPGKAAAAMVALGRSLLTGAQNGLNSLLGVLSQLPGRAGNALRRIIPVMRDTLTGALRAARDAAVGGIQRLVGAIASVPGRINALRGRMVAAGAGLIRGFLSGLGRVGGFIGNIAGSIVGAIRGFLNQVIGRLNAGIASLDAKLPFSLPRVPQLAEGGLTTRGGLAQLHANELVLPLQDRRAVDLLAAAMQEANQSLRAVGTPTVETPMNFDVRVFLGDRELTDLVDVQISRRDRQLRRRVTAGAGRGVSR